MKRGLYSALIALLLVCQSSSLHAQTGAETLAQQGRAYFEAGQYQEAAQAFEQLLSDYATSPQVPEAQFRLGYAYYLLGEFDKSMEMFRKILGPPAPAEIQELAANMLPQAIAAKAAKMPPDDPKRKATFQEAIKLYEDFVKKFPASQEVETANYGRALALYQIGEYAQAADVLRENVQRFPTSESILDSQFLLALTLATQANLVQQKTPNQPNPQATALYDQAEKLLRDIIQKRTDVALANDAQFQLGEILFNRAALADADRKAVLYDEALSAYRAVEPKEQMIQAQQTRLAGILQRLRAVGAAGQIPELRRLQRLQERELAKLETIKNRPDQTLSAKLKQGMIFFQQDRVDEARVMFSYLQKFAEDAEHKKNILYYITLSYALQLMPEKAVENYNAFQEQFKGDLIADNLPLAMGIMFVNSKVNQPEEALKYFQQGLELYPQGRFAGETLTQQATALVALKQFDQALATFQKFLQSNPPPELAAQAEVGIATIYGQTGKLDEALQAFRQVRDKYSGTQAAEQAAFNAGGIALQKQDAQTAITEFQNFLQKHPNSELVPSALFYLGAAYQTAGNALQAVETFRRIIEEHPKSEYAESAFLQTANIHLAAGNHDQMEATLREFLEKYPQSEKVFDARTMIAQTHIAAGNLQKAIDSYEEFVDNNPQHSQAPRALLQISQLWRQHLESLGRYLALNEEQRAEWEKSLTNSMEAAEKVITQYPESEEVALALQNLLDIQRMNIAAQRKTDEQVAQYFQELAGRFEDKPATKNKVLFTFAAFIYEEDQAKALAQMQAAYDPALVYAPADLDLFGSALIDEGKLDEARQVYEKLAADYSLPPGVTPEQAPPAVAEAQATALFGIGQVFRKQGDVAEAAARFNQLKEQYPWTPKSLEANYGIAEGLLEEKKYDEAMGILVQVIRAQTATAELRANSMLLGGKIQEAQGNIEAAIDYYIKIATFYEGVPEAAAEGLWRGAQLLEKQAAEL